MRCVIFSINSSFQLDPIISFIKETGYEIKRQRQVIHCYHPTLNADLFIFPMGSFVSWGLTSKQERNLFQNLLKFIDNPSAPQTSDYFSYHYGKETKWHTHKHFNIEILSLENHEANLKLAVAYALAQSGKLACFEMEAQKTIAKNKLIPTKLALKGKIKLSGKEISQRIGEIYLARTSINLHSEYLGTPQYFWEHPSLEANYFNTKQFFDIEERVAVLDQRLSVMQDLFDILTGQLQHRHSSILEIIIILLIVLEVVMNVLQLMR